MNQLSPRLLFVCKHRQHYWGSTDPSSGLFVSVRLLVAMLNAVGIPAEFVDVVDNNAIDREVTRVRPSHVIIEALWVIPEKFPILRKLHPHVHWAVRLHSNAPFLASEGVALQWLRGYLMQGVEVISNSLMGLHDVKVLARELGVSDQLVTYGPNYYPLPVFQTPHARTPGVANIGCFGAIRPLKNQLAQAMAALNFAHANNLQLRFNMNTTRVEGAGEPVLRNLQALLGSQLISWPWETHDVFLATLRTMDVSLQVSLTETFNLVAADSVACSVPTVVSQAIDWLDDYQVGTSATDIAQGIAQAWTDDPVMRAHRQRHDLAEADSDAEAEWLDRYRGG